MDVVLLAKFLNQISQAETSYENMSTKIQKAYQQKAVWIIDFFTENGWVHEDAKNTEQANQPDSHVIPGRALPGNCNTFC